MTLDELTAEEQQMLRQVGRGTVLFERGALMFGLDHIKRVSLDRGERETLRGLYRHGLIRLPDDIDGGVIGAVIEPSHRGIWLIQEMRVFGPPVTDDAAEPEETGVLECQRSARADRGGRLDALVKHAEEHDLYTATATPERTR